MDIEVVGAQQPPRIISGPNFDVYDERQCEGPVLVGRLGEYPKVNSMAKDIDVTINISGGGKLTLDGINISEANSTFISLSGEGSTIILQNCVLGNTHFTCDEHAKIILFDCVFEYFLCFDVETGGQVYCEKRVFECNAHTDYKSILKKTAICTSGFPSSDFSSRVMMPESGCTVVERPEKARLAFAIDERYDTHSFFGITRDIFRLCDKKAEEHNAQYEQYVIYDESFSKRETMLIHIE